MEVATGLLGRFVSESRWEEVPAAVRHEAKRSLLNFLGCALGVANSPAVETAAQLVRRFSGPTQASLIGRAERLDMLSACFVNAIAANLLDYDDTHLDTVIHPTAPVAPAVLALAEEHGLSGAEALHALLLGMEVECRIGNAVSPNHYARGWHITATCGVFGATAASARLLGLSAAVTGHALGVAASEASGLVENLPTAAKNVGVGNAARNGLFAALIAEAGYTAAPEAIEGRLGWARAMGDAPRIDALSGALGAHWEAARNTYKPYPCGIVMHPVIDACLALRARGVRPEMVHSVIVRGPSLLLERGDRPVANERDARVSIHHCAAVALQFGAAGVREFEPDMVTAPDVVALRNATQAEIDAAIPVGAATVIVALRDGTRHEARVAAARGSEANPLSDADIEAKVRDCAAASAIRDVASVIDQVWRLDELPDMRPLLRALSAC
ncbi:MAG: MmgE/PrpD family protein [Alphaproteobacteria bacterium]|nr:MmgE/PrpD family protein [Alphaproteobacteria bacterium]